MRAMCVFFGVSGLVSACAFSVDGFADRSPMAIVDAYLIAHGMAESYGDRPEADPAVMTELERLDARAGAAIRSLAQSDGRDTDATAKAVAALTDYAARQAPASR